MVVQVKKYSVELRVMRDISRLVCCEKGSWLEQCSLSLQMRTLWLNLFKSPLAKLLLVEISSIMSIRWSDSIASVEDKVCWDTVSGLNLGGTVSVGWIIVPA